MKRPSTSTSTPISQGFLATGGVARMTNLELIAFTHITQWAAIGCLHEGASTLGAQLMKDARWLDAQMAERAVRAQRP